MVGVVGKGKGEWGGCPNQHRCLTTDTLLLYGVGLPHTHYFWP